jgi:hypothetical protein
MNCWFKSLITIHGRGAFRDCFEETAYDFWFKSLITIHGRGAFRDCFEETAYDFLNATM